MLRPLADGIWEIHKPFRMGGQDMRVRMVVVRLPDGSLWLHSPIRLTEGLRGALAALGPVRAVVAPSQLHHLFLPAYFAAYPDARFFSAPGLGKKRPDLPFNEVLTDQAPPLWAEVLDQRVFRGLRSFGEVVFYHKPSRTLILADCAFNVQRADSLWEQAFFRLNGMYRRFGPSRAWRLLVKDKRAARATVQQMLAWSPERITVAHGDIVEQHAEPHLRAGYQWLLS